MTTPGKLIRARIKELRLQQATVATVTRIDPAQLSRIITGKRAVDFDTALRLEAALDVKAKSLLEAQLESDLSKAKKSFTEEA